VRSDIINEVLSVEDRAQQIIRDAEHKARDSVSDAQTKANELLRSSTKEEREHYRVLLEKAEEESYQELTSFEESLDMSSNISPDQIIPLASSIVEEVCKTDFDTIVDANE